MKRTLLLILLLTLLTTLQLFSNPAWNNNNTNTKSLELIIGYNPSIVNYVYGKQPLENIILNYDNQRFSYYFSDSGFINLNYNFPFYQIGYTFSYRWLHGLKTFSLSNLFRIVGFNFDVYNFSIKFSLADIGFSWYKYGWFVESIHKETIYLLLSPITLGLDYRISLNDNIDFVFSNSYSMQVIFNNLIYFPNKDYSASLFLEHVFNMGFGLRFNFK